MLAESDRDVAMYKEGNGGATEAGVSGGGGEWGVG